MHSLNPAQQQVLDAGLLWSGFHAVLHMPTGTGKTWLASLAVEHALARGQRAVVLVPLRAQAEELAADWEGRLSGVVAVHGGRPGSPRQARVLITTPERLDLLTRQWRRHWDWLPRVGLVVVDELHLLGEPGRGPRLEGALGRLRRLNPLARILGLSATLGNAPELAAWLGGVAHRSTWRPVPLRWRVERYARPEDKPQRLLSVLESSRERGRSLVFVQSRRRAEALAAQLDQAGLRAAHHHAGLSPLRRAEVEQSLRERDLDAVVSTGTLEMGLNLPVRQVVLYDLQRFDGWRHVPLEVWRVWQRAGRAGRPGLDAEGEAVLLAPPWDRHARAYPEGRFEPVRSGLDRAEALAEQVVVEVHTGLARTRPQLARALGRSLAAHQGRLLDLDRAVDEMVEAGLLEEGAGKLGVTRLGRVAARHLLAPAAVSWLVGALRGVEAPTTLDLLLVALASGECALIPPDFEALEALGASLSSRRSWLLHGARSLLPRGRRLLAVLHSAALLLDWCETGDEEQTGQRWGCYPAQVRGLREEVRRVLAALAALSEGDLQERVRALDAMLTAGLDAEAVSLTQLPGLGPVLARRLVAMGISEVEALAEADADELAAVRGVSRARAQAWIEASLSLSAWRFRDEAPCVSPRPHGWPEGVDPYRLRRALDLEVVSRGSWLEVRGGSEPRRVEGEACDCPDHAAGHLCKHLLAARLHRGHAATRALVERLSQADAGGLDLMSLWMDR